ncbi:peptidase S8/S53 subtilisin kexin sedolisin [Gracilaria domingensis]|nr:peptidase S8/S53 subtilisin kexin sedolisin [Gracilaria domingensis]
MRILPLLFAALLGVAHAVSKGYVRKRFIVSLEPENECDSTCVEAVKKSIAGLTFQGKSAQCEIIRHNVHLGMITVKCGCVRNDTTAMLVNDKLQQIDGVMYSAQDVLLTTAPTDSDAQDESTGGPDTPMFVPASREVVPEGFSPYNWGLDRIDQEDANLDRLPTDYSCYPRRGKGVRVFVIDTGCRVDHNEFVNLDITTQKAPGSSFANGVDDNGHGTHIAGLIGGTNVGIARDASVTCIKAFDHHGNGIATDTIAAVEYIIEEKAKNASVPFIVNLSYSALTGFTTTPLDEIVYSSSDRGIVFVVSAGNSAVNSCFFSPSKAKQAFTVAASTKQDALEMDSNKGSCVEFIAPGHEIVSAGISSPTDYESMNGTSMATPHVAGLSALVLSENMNLQSNPATVRDSLYEMLLTNTANVADFILPRMQVGCSTVQNEVNMRRADGYRIAALEIVIEGFESSPEKGVEPLETLEPFMEGEEEDLIPSNEPEEEGVPAIPVTFVTSSSQAEQLPPVEGNSFEFTPEKRNKENHDIMVELMNFLQQNNV